MRQHHAAVGLRRPVKPGSAASTTRLEAYVDPLGHGADATPGNASNVGCIDWSALYSPRMRLRSSALATSFVLLLCALVVLAGCGGSSSSSSKTSSSSSSGSDNGLASKSPEQIVAAAKAAAVQARTVHIAGSIVSENKPISLDMELVAGHGGKGKLTIDYLPVRLVQIDKDVYINGSEAFYKHVAGATAAKLLQGKWLKAPAGGSDFRELTQLTDLSKLIDATL
ncbi:MAG TPA: hypothetical protein VH025_10215, partial [Solirubrobacteraceae bacterium]|nr:hypothetical protein [Solirubrobacteraceae bacterium]